MVERRSLIEGLKTTPTEAEKAFVFSASASSTPPGEVSAANTTPPVAAQTRSPVSTRIRTDFATALKRASLERQLAGTMPNTISDILDEALEPWLKTNGYLP